MTGSNTIQLNQASVEQAVQFWLNEKVLRTPHVVTSFSREQENTCPVFHVTIEEPKTEKLYDKHPPAQVEATIPRPRKDF